MVTCRKEAILKVKRPFEDGGFSEIEVLPAIDQALEISQGQVFSFVFIYEPMEQPWAAPEMGLLIRNLQHTPIVFLSSPSIHQQKAWSLLLLMDSKAPVSLAFTPNGLRLLVEAALGLTLPAREQSE